ncbi:hypothetical protein DER46DRAFT_635329 [Fusarium sp. MPI-SDFR-AT-0072]|nr:hypothetical protein DER46DRAFT_635329 [Fusarium sp. MPI-SDFR-AT-0072]
MPPRLGKDARFSISFIRLQICSPTGLVTDIPLAGSGHHPHLIIGFSEPGLTLRLHFQSARDCPPTQGYRHSTPAPAMTSNLEPMRTGATLEFITVDVFTRQRYHGNPLAVVLVPTALSGRISGEVKQRIAREFNLSETVFLYMPDASSAFRSKSLTICTSIPASWLTPCGISPSLDESIRKAELQAPLVSIVKGMTALLVKLPSLELLSRVSTASRLRFDEPIQDLLLDKGPWGSSFCYRYYYVPLEEGDESKSDDKADVRRLRARMVELASEDPATGSAAVTLGAYLAMQEHADQEAIRFEITQGVEMGRQSEITVEVKLKSRAKIEEIYLGGSAVVVMNGVINI